MCETWLERSWREEQTLQRNSWSKNNSKYSNRASKFFVSAFNAPGNHYNNDPVVLDIHAFN